MQISQEQYNKLPERLQKHFNHGNFHCTVKSVPLMEYLIKMITPKGGTVLDPFMGSGTTGIACKKNGFDFIGIEKEPEYMKIAEVRINNTKLQQKLI
jgi:DNA modification methylase